MLNTKHKILIARVLQVIVMFMRKLARRGCITEAVRSGVRWKLNLREGIDFSIWLLGLFEPETVRCYQILLRPGDVVLDIGANIGAHTLLLAKSVGDQGRVIAFEPTDFAFSKLCTNCALNPELFRRINCQQIMLVDSDADTELTPSLYSSWPLMDEAGAHDIHQGRLMSTSGARARTLDTVIFSMDVERIDFIKLDIDGYECSMLRGASKVLTKWRPTIIMELAPYVLEEHGASLEELVHILSKTGYRFFSLANDTPLPSDASQLRKLIPEGGSINVLAKAEALDLNG